MKKNIALLLMSLFCFTAGAQAQEGYNECCGCCGENNFYAKVLGGVNFLQDTTIDGNKASYKTGYIIGGALGYHWCYGLHLEAEYAYRRHNIKDIHFYVEGSSDSGHYQSSSYMANLLWDLPLCSWGCPFSCVQAIVGAGIGYDFQQMHSSNARIVFDQDWHRFSWQLMARLAYEVVCNTEVSLEYTFHQGGSHFNNHSLGVGLTYKFDFGCCN